MVTMNNKNYEEQVRSLMAHIQEADAIVVGEHSECRRLRIPALL